MTTERINEARIPDVGDPWLLPGSVKLTRTRVEPKPWWARLLEALRLRKPAWRVTYEFEVINARPGL